MEASIQVAKIAADAAATSAQSGIESERAHLFVILDGETFSSVIEQAAIPNWTTKQRLPHPYKDGLPNMFLSFHVRNYGRTPGVISEISHQIIHAKNLPWPLEYSAALDGEVIDYVVASEKNSPRITCEPDSVFTIADFESIAREDTRLWFYGYVVYFDVFDRRIERRFMWEFSNGAFRMNYQRERISEHNQDTGDVFRA
jgi:hypothetical protein